MRKQVLESAKEVYMNKPRKVALKKRRKNKIRLKAKRKTQADT